MKVLFDANVVLDVLLKRPGFAQAAMPIAKVPEPWLSTLSLANILFIVGRSKSGCIQIFETDSPFIDIRISFDDAAAPEFFEHLGNAANPSCP